MSYAEMRGNPAPRSVSRSQFGSGHGTPTTAGGAQRARRIRSRGAAAAGGGGALAGSFRRRGRPPKLPSPPPREVYRRTAAPLVAFLCEWAECRAELHNLETLRRHVRVVHSSDGGGVCRWGRCEAREAPEIYFADGGDLGRHVEEAHLVPFAWHVGDGPSNAVPGGGGDKGDSGEGDKGDKGDEVPSYLKDAGGTQVTPWVRDQELEDWVTWRDNRRKLKELLIRMDENLPSEESDGAVDEADG
ncbi:Zinc finger protein 536 [Escovopsis weberi]|uniref:Zinc finger protein 536 n=1 Tax=Escovopsis weberi TaxID=150374 RepID=A0A0M8N1Y0_ESCWE|nr:Zinc finger protein 536 [Escovopsis weberi]